MVKEEYPFKYAPNPGWFAWTKKAGERKVYMSGIWLEREDFRRVLADAEKWQQVLSILGETVDCVEKVRRILHLLDKKRAKVRKS